MPPEDDPRDAVRSDPCPECGEPVVYEKDEDLYHCTKCDWLVHWFDKNAKKLLDGEDTGEGKS